MANPGVGTKFVSVNLNKSYGQSQQQQYHHHNNHQYGAGRNRGGGGGGGGGMVVLSRPRSSQKVAGTKLSVPHPLNLPSLRKEHERFDSSGTGGGPTGGASGVGGVRPSSSGMGWTKPAVVGEKDGFIGVGTDHTGDISISSVNHVFDQGGNGVVNGVSKGNSSSLYVPPSVRSVGPAASGLSPSNQVPGKATVLRGEDFPSLQAALPVVSVSEKKQKDGLFQKQKQVMNENLGDEQGGRSGLSALVDLGLHSRNHVSNGENEKEGKKRGLGGAGMFEKDRRQEEFFPGPLPLVKLNLRSDWADDERDTGHGLMDRGRDHVFTKNEAYWDRDSDFPRPSVLPQKPTCNHFDRCGQRDNETGKITSSEAAKLDTFGRDTRATSREGREGNSWRVSSHLVMDGFGIQEGGNERSGIGTRPYNQNRKINYENKYVPSPFRDNVQHGNERRDVGYGHVGRHPHSNSMDPFGGRASDRSSRESYGNEQYNNHRSDHFQSNSTSKSLFSLGGKGLTVNDPILSFGREKRPSSKNEKAFFNDPFIRDFGAIGFDGHDPFDGAFVSLVKKKKDVVKQTDFHDPVRESFEAELERVQKVQEQERQRIIAEQERAMELARREEDERIRLAREQEEQQRRLEDEAREAARRAEQEKLELMRKAEEQRMAREEEKRRIIMEEERRKQAAKQKLLELEEKIAKRHAETTKNNNSYTLTDEKISVTATEKLGLKLADIGDWEDGERMVERITTSASADSSGSNRPFEMGSRPLFSRDASSSFLDRGKHHSSWKRDAFENGNSSSFLSHDRENGHHSPQHDSAAGGRVFSRKEAHGGPGFMSSKTYYKGGIPEPRMDDFRQIKGQRWDLSGDGDHFSRNLEFESEFHETLTERFGDGGWGQSSRARGTLYTPFPEHVYHNSETDGLYSFGRSRHSTRQPRVLPPPSMNSMQRSSYRGDQHPGPSTFTLNELPYNDGTRSKSTMQKMFDNSHQEIISTAQITHLNKDSTENAAQEMDMDTKRCDSQSSLSVSSPPDSPVHISHDDLDDSGDFPGSAADCKDETLGLQVNESAALPIDSEKEKMMSESSYDDEEWPIETDDPLQEQEEYDEDEDGYGEGDEAHDGEDENTNLAQEFEDLHLEEKGSPDMVDNLVLGFNEGVEVGMPNDEFERNLRDEDAKFVPPQVSVGNVKELGSLDGICSEEQALQNMTDSVELGLDDTSGIFQETEKTQMQDLVIQPKHVPQTSAASEHMNHMDTPSTGLSSQAQVPLSTGQIFMSSAPSVHGQSEVPVKLQFGLFSGPSLIPSPVPAIQIGSIQMPLHLHPPVGPSGTQMHPSQPFFQFGQLQYTSPISQGVSPLAPQSMSFVEPTVPANFPLNQNAGGPLPIQSAQETSHNLIKVDLLSVSADSQSGPLSQHLDLLSHGKVSKDGKLLPSSNAILKLEQGQGELSCTGDGNLMGESGFQMEESFMKNFKMLPTKELGDQPQTVKSSLQIASKDKDSNLVKGRGIITGGRRKRYVVKNSGLKSSLQPAEASQQDPGAFQRRPRHQRTEFRVRENADKKQSVGSISSSLYGDDKSNTDGKAIGARNGSKRVVSGSNRQPKHKFESDGLSSRLVAWETDSGGRVENGSVKQSLRKNVSHSGEDVDTSLQSGNIVRIFEQPGIKAPSDDDDFIEVKSKRQMVNDRREQREKEIKAKSHVTKTMRKPRSASQTTAGNINSSKISASVGGGSSSNSHTDFVSTERHGLGNIEVSVGFNTPVVSQPLPPIGTPAVKNDVQADKRSQTIKSTETSSLPVGGGKNLSSGLMFENKNKVLDNVKTPLGSWANPQINQQVMSLMQTQLNEAMKPGKLDSRSSIGDSTLSVGEPSLTSSSIMAKDKSFPSASNTINSLLAGDKIQFGAVTSPTILPSSSRASPHGIGNLGVCRPDIQIAHNLSAADNQRSIFFGKDKHSNESSMHLEDCEAEAEAAASAVAVAAISSDDIVANGLGTGPVSSNSKSFGGADIDDVSGDQHLASRSRAEESLSVALPADLSVETHPMSLWPPLPSPQHSSSQMLSHIPGGPTSHFPFYEMNPMLGGPIFAFGPHDEHASTQSQSHQKSNTPVSGPHGTWQHHSGVDSFYGHPAGFTGPFISPPGSIPGVQGPPHMVVYNHFAPVGQFGQVGLSFMGTTYIPPGKQPDWKHNPVSSAMVAGEGEMNSLDIVSAQRNPTSVPAPIQHIAPGSPLLPMASPLAMFDAPPPFQSAPDMSVQARWSHVSASPLQSVSASMPLQQQSEGVLPTQLNHGLSVDQSLATNRFSESQISRSSDNGRNIPGATDATVNQLPDELGLVDSSRSSSTRTLAQSNIPKSPSAITIQDASTTDGTQNCTSNSFSQNTSSALKTQPSHQKTASGQLYNSSGYNYQRGGSVPQKNISGGEWSYRRMGYNGRNQSLGGEKNVPSSKMKQIYVAKQTTGATSTVL